MAVSTKVFLFLCFLSVASSEPSSNSSEAIEITKLQIFPEEKARALLFEDSNRGGRIVFGSYATTNQFPHFGYAVIYRSASSTWCGSALISPLWVLTAAHCMNDCIGAQIYFGSLDKQLMKISRSAYGYTIHPSYQKPSALMNDIAAIKLSSTVTLSASVQPILLPTRSDQAINYTGRVLTVVGFGKTATGYPRYLQYTYLNGLSNEACLTAHWVFRDTMLCGVSAYSSGSGICFGDSGGPLSLPLPDGQQVTLIGINSYVQTSECVGDVQGFTRVDRYLDWLNQLTGITIKM